MKYNTDLIRERYNRGEKLEFIFFWGHTSKPGKIKKSCLSQWYDCRFEENGVLYHTTEQYMMSKKALLFGDNETFEKIMSSEDPRDYKALGREVKNFDPETWDAKKYEIVLAGNILKFSQNEELKSFLLDTGEKVLAEASPYDGIWGVCLAMDNPLIENPNNWNGENLLGFALMETRDILRDAGQM